MAGPKVHAAVLASLLAGATLGLPAVCAQDAVPAAAAAPQPPAANIQSLLADLGSPDLKVRMTASEKIQDGPYSLKDVEAALRTETLAPEQRQRLLAIAAHRFETEPRGAMGIQFNLAAPDTRGALVESPKRGFHAFEVLRPRDRIVHADGVVIERQQTLRKIIVGHDPGDEIPLVVERDGATIDVKVRLGEFASLQQPMDRQIRDEAWMHRSRDYTRPLEGDLKPVESGLLEASWMQVPELEDDAELLGQLPWIRARLISPTGERLGVTAGGEARSGLGQDGSQGAEVLRGPQIAPQNNAQMQLQVMRLQREQNLRLLIDARQQLNQPNITPDRRRELERQILGMKQNIELADRQIRDATRRLPQPARP